MIVCHCHGLTDRDIRAAAARSGAGCCEELGAACPAASACGGCRPLVDELLTEARIDRAVFQDDMARGDGPRPDRAPRRRSA